MADSEEELIQQLLSSTPPRNKKARLDHEAQATEAVRPATHAKASMWPATQIINDGQDGSEATLWPATQIIDDGHDGTEVTLWPATQIIDDIQDGATARLWPATQIIDDDHDDAKASVWPATQIFDDGQDGAAKTNVMWPGTQSIDCDRDGSASSSKDIVIDDDHDDAKASVWPATQIFDDGQDGAAKTNVMWPGTQSIDCDRDGSASSSKDIVTQQFGNHLPQQGSTSSSASQSHGKEIDLLELVMAFDASPQPSLVPPATKSPQPRRNYETDDEINRRVLREMDSSSEDAEWALLLHAAQSDNVDSAVAAMQRLLELGEAETPKAVNKGPSTSPKAQPQGVHWTSLIRNARGSTEDIVSALHAEIVRRDVLICSLSEFATLCEVMLSFGIQLRPWN